MFNVHQRMPARIVVTLLALLACGPATAQSTNPPRRLGTWGPAGARSYLTENWGVVEVAIANPSGSDMEARFLTYYANAPGTQYGRDLWLPAKATHRSWYCIGPPPMRPERGVIELNSVLYDRTGGQERLLRATEGTPLHSHLARFEQREQSTAVMLDTEIADGSRPPPTQDEVARANEVRDLVRILRNHRGLSERVTWVRQRFLPPAAEAMDGVDHFVLASSRIGEDVAGRRVLREWLLRGGSLWILLDFVSAEAVAELLGDAPHFDVVDRVSLTHVDVRTAPDNPNRTASEPRDFEVPVDFVRIQAPGWRTLYTVDGWPAACITEVGRGRLMLTTLGPRGWMRPRVQRDGPSPYKEFPALPLPLGPFAFLAVEFHPNAERPLIAADDLRAYVAEQISYAVVGRETVALVFGGFFAVLLAAAVALGMRGLLEHVGWLGPAAALAATGIFVGLGELSRSGLPATVAMVQLVDAEPGLQEAPMSGYLAIYEPTLDTSMLGVQQGGQFDLDMSGLEGRVHRRVQTDLERWHWENLDLPAGVRMAPFQHTTHTRQPIEATARFGPDGLEGRVTPDVFGRLEDVLLSTPGQRAVAVQLQEDGSFTARSDDELPAGRHLAGALLTDRQRARQRLYEKYLAEPQPRSIANRVLVHGWAEPVDMHFALASGARTTGAALLTIPLRWEPTPPGTRVTVPAAFVECRRVTSDGGFYRAASESRHAATMRLRFQLPAAVRPLLVESARLILKLDAPGREVDVALVSNGKPVPARHFTSPHGTAIVQFNDPMLLALDERGALFVDLQISNLGGDTGGQDQWRLQTPGLEVRGRTPEAQP